jgi:hypothetical protein
MDGPTYVQRRRKKYLAQTMEAFEQLIEPHLSGIPASDVADFKGLIRAKYNALATDAADAMNLTDSALNGYAVELTDRLFPNGRPRTGQRSQ